LRLSVACSIGLATTARAQEAPPNAPKFVKFAKAPGVEVSYLDFRWDEEAFRALEKGEPQPSAQRSWMLARLLLQTEPLRWKGRIIPVGPSVLVLHPKSAGTEAMLELRAVDMRELFVDMNVIAEPPPGETYQKAKASFRKANSTAPRLAVSLDELGRSYELHLHYGNRKTSITLER
jgi:hypothetical protein